MTEVSYNFNLSPGQVSDFKSDLQDFASQNEYRFVDRSLQTNRAREYINRVTENDSGKPAGLATGGEFLDIILEPRNPKLDLFVFAKTSAYDLERVDLAVIYDKNSPAEAEMATNFLKSKLLQDWKQ